METCFLNVSLLYRNTLNIFKKKKNFYCIPSCLEEANCVLVWFKFIFFFSPWQVYPLRSTCTVQHWQTRRSSKSWRRISCPNFSSSPWDQWRDPTPQAGPAPPRPSWAGTAGPRAPAHTASSAAAPRRSPAPLPQITVPGPPGRKRRRTEEFFSTLTGPVSPSRV